MKGQVRNVAARQSLIETPELARPSAQLASGPDPLAQQSVFLNGVKDLRLLLAIHPVRRASRIGGLAVVPISTETSPDWKTTADPSASRQDDSRAESELPTLDFAN